MYFQFEETVFTLLRIMKYNVICHINIYKVHKNCFSKLNFSIIQRVHGAEVAELCISCLSCPCSPDSHWEVQHDNRDGGCWMVQGDHGPWSHPDRSAQQIPPILGTDEM